MRNLLLAVVFSFFFAAVPAVHAHPVPKNSYDRTITVRFQKAAKSGQFVLRVDYRLEVDETTIVGDDMKPYRDEVDILQYLGKPLAYYAEFTRIYGPILANHLLAKLDGKELEIRCVERRQSLEDEKKQALGHLRCDFVFRAEFSCSPDKEHTFRFKELNYQFSKGQIHLSLVNDAGLDILSTTEPDAALKSRSAFELEPGDESKLREIKVKFRLAPSAAEETAPPVKTVPITPSDEPTAKRADEHRSGIFELFLHNNYGLVVMLVVAAWLGAAHAMTPGHGKTLMAAYLVGERGTVWHAVILGLVTALTHTGAVLIIALAMFFSEALGQALLAGLTGISLGLGLVVVCLGFYLLLQRLSGGHDHIHIGGGHHHHHHHPDLGENKSQKVTIYSLVLLGISGGIIPCFDAIALLVLSIGAGVFWLAFPLLLSFSAGLAGALVLVGIVVVKFRNLAQSRWGEGRLVRSLPIVSALIVIAMGFWLCYEAVHG